MEGKKKGKLRISAGAGEGYEVDSEVVAGFSGRTGDALQQLIDEHVRDPELRRLLAEPNIVLELSGNDEEGEFQSALSADSDWQEGVVNGLVEGDRRLGLRRVHQGGR